MMSTPFTVNDDNWQEKAEELRLAYSERRHATHGNYRKYAWRITDEETGEGVWEWQDGDGTENDVLPEGTNLQASSFWGGLQNYAHSYYLAWCDPDLSPAGKFYYEVGPYASFKQLCERAGDVLYVDDDDYGWPRSFEVNEETGDPVMTRGAHQEGDIIGAWIIDSLVSVFNVMTHRFVFGSENLGQWRKYIGSGMSREEAISNAKDSSPVETRTMNGCIIGTIDCSVGYIGPSWACLIYACGVPAGLTPIDGPIVSRKYYAKAEGAIVGDGADILAGLGVTVDGKLSLVSTTGGSIGYFNPNFPPFEADSSIGKASLDRELVEYDFTNGPEE